MPRFCANLSYLFLELPYLERHAAARSVGFKAVEVQFPYDTPSADVAASLRRAGLEQVLINAPSGNGALGDRGLASLPGRESEFKASIATALDYARTLKCTRIHVVAGAPSPGLDVAACERTYRENLAWAADQARPHGVTLMLEPINRRDIPGFFLRDTKHAAEVIADVGADNVRLQYDLYHAQIIEGDLARTLERNLGIIGHMQIAAPPERCEPDHGEVNFPYLFDLIDRLGYAGWIGCEYRPRNGTVAGLGWARAYGIGGT
ncbi:MAG TPA: 2-oxo-tetronate isomerase [Candidatus Cybelea sp.]|nr:2-oxo-tetronate isomerase [Candidatus Cybelea sp.]